MTGGSRSFLHKNSHQFVDAKTVFWKIDILKFVSTCTGTYPNPMTAREGTARPF